jgi:peptidoglycan/LPS O-acetylase OafA/YrhL
MRPAATVSSRVTYEPAIDGLRALAIGAVLLFHSGYGFAGGGFLGVSLFFTVSGFLITTLLLGEHERSGRIDLRGFWERRFRRLAPAAVVVLAGITIAAPHLADASQRAGLRGDVLSALGYVANWRFLLHGQSYAAMFSTPSPVQHFWSLSIEEQYYLVYPVIVAVVLARARRSPRRALAWTLGVLAAGSLASQLAASSFDRLYYGTDTRLFEIVAGALLAVVVAGRRERLARLGRRSALALGVVALAAFAFFVEHSTLGGHHLQHGGLALFACVSVALLVAALVPGPFSNAIGNRPLAAIGRVSYGLYLIHWPVFLWLDESRTGWHGVPLLGARMAVVAPLTFLSYRLLETPVRFSFRLRTRRRFASTCTAGVALTAVLALVVPTVAAPLSQAQAIVATTRSSLETAHGALRVMVVGDSTGSALAQGLIAAHDPRLVVADATENCPLVAGHYSSWYAGAPLRDVRSCASVVNRWVARAREFHPQLIVVDESIEDTSDFAIAPSRPAAFNILSLPVYAALETRYAAVAAQLRATGAIVAWARVPTFSVAAAPSARSDEGFDRRIDLLNATSTQTAARQLGVVPLDLASHFGAPGSPVDRIIRPDGMHVAPALALIMAKIWLADALVSAFREGAREVGVDTGGVGAPAARVLVVGDSTSLGLAAGLAEYGRSHGNIVVDWDGHYTCPIVHATLVTMPDGARWPTYGCVDLHDTLAMDLPTFRPDVVLVVSSLTDASDLQMPRHGIWHVGERRYCDAYLAAMHDAATETHAAHATLFWATAPRATVGSTADTRLLDARTVQLNALIGRGFAQNPEIEPLALAAQLDRPDGVVDRSVRPDGVHISVDAGTRLADSWLAAIVLAAAARH